jgi:TonB family protein
MGTEKVGLVFVVAIAFGTGSVLAAHRSQDQTNPPAAQNETAQQPRQPQRVRVSVGVAQGLLVKRVQPKYPEKARQQGVQGMVVLKILISREGDVRGITVVSGDPLLAPEAIRVVQQWKYKHISFRGIRSKWTRKFG